MTRLFVVSTIRLLRDELVGVFAAAGDLDVVGSRASLAAALPVIGELKPDVVVVAAGDLDDAHELDRLVAAGSRAVLFGIDADDDEILRYVHPAVIGYVGAEAGTEDLLEATHAAAGGVVTCSPEVATALIRNLAEPPPVDTTGWNELSPREREILELIGEGLMNKQIAQRLHIASATVKNHVYSIFKKLQVHRRADAVALLPHPAPRLNPGEAKP